MEKYRLSLLCVVLFFSVNVLAVVLDAKLEWSGIQKHGFTVNGIVEDVSVNPGQKVKKGSVLASLSAEPFLYKLKKCQASINKFEPLILDAKLEFDQAEELYERTVLSEVELQKIEGKHKVLLERQNEVKADCLLLKWELKQTVLKAKDSVYIVNSNIMPGMVVSDENKSTLYIESASSKKAYAIAVLSYAQKKQFNIGQELQVSVDLQDFPAKVKSIDLRPNKDNNYKVIAEFYYTKVIEPGKLLKLKF